MAIDREIFDVAAKEVAHRGGLPEHGLGREKSRGGRKHSERRQQRFSMSTHSG